MTDPSRSSESCRIGGDPLHLCPLLLMCRCMALLLGNHSPHVARVVLNLSTDKTSGMSVLPPALVLGSSGGDAAGLFDP